MQHIILGLILGYMTICALAAMVEPKTLPKRSKYNRRMGQLCRKQKHNHLN